MNGIKMRKNTPDTRLSVKRFFYNLFIPTQFDALLNLKKNHHNSTMSGDSSSVGSKRSRRG